MPDDGADTALAAVPVWFFLMAATWSRIDGGTSELMLLILTMLVTPIARYPDSWQAGRSTANGDAAAPSRL